MSTPATPSLRRRRGTKAKPKPKLAKSSLPFNLVAGLLVFLAFLLSVFVYGIAYFVFEEDDEKRHEKAAKVVDTLRHKVQAVPNLLRRRNPDGTTAAGQSEEAASQISKKESSGSSSSGGKSGGSSGSSTGGGKTSSGRRATAKSPKQAEDSKDVYPYPLVEVPSNYDIDTAWAPLGGHRFTEYTKGDPPSYAITDELREQSDKVARSRRVFVKKAMEHAWAGYKRYAFGQDEVLPQTGQGNQGWGSLAITMVDSLDTLWLMGLKDDFQEAREWIAGNLNHNKNEKVSVFETTIRDLGGLLSAFDLSGDKLFLEKAHDLGSRLIKSFGTQSGIPYGQVDLSTGEGRNIPWANNYAITAEFGTLQVENRYLSKMTGEHEFAYKTEEVFHILQRMSREDGLFPNFVRNNGGPTPSFGNEKITFGAMGDSVYEYMLKIWLQGGRTEPMYREMWDKAVEGMHNSLLQHSKPSGLTYIADRNNGNLDHKMDHLVCFMGGALALGAYTDPLGLDSVRAKRDLKTARALTYTCYQMYARMRTGISPEFVQFNSDRNDFVVGRNAPHYLLRPEAFESFYILNHLTGDPVYREWGWECFQSIEKYCKTSIAYGALSNVQDARPVPRNKMESFFLAETLKYLYLLQDPESEIDLLNKHVFNTEAHPLRMFPVIDADEEKSK